MSQTTQTKKPAPKPMPPKQAAPPAAKPPEPKALTVVDAIRSDLTKMEPQFKAALPPHISPEKFMRVAITAIQTNANLTSCDKRSLFGACMKAAQDGLLPDGKEAALVPFKGLVQYMPMVAGILKKVRNSGEIASISPHVVHENDTFEYWIDENGEHLTHRPLMSGERGEITHAYAVAKTKDGAVYIEVMSKSELEQVRKVSRAGDGGPWKSWYGEMARKTVIRRLSKRLPMSTDLEQVVHADDEIYDLNKPAEEEKKPAGTKPSRLGKIIEAQHVEPEEQFHHPSDEVQEEAQDVDAEDVQFTTDEEMPI